MDDFMDNFFKTDIQEARSIVIPKSKIPGIMLIVISVLTLIVLVISVSNLVLYFNDDARPNQFNECINADMCLASFITDLICCVSAVAIIIIMLTYMIYLSVSTPFVVNYKFNKYVAWPFVILVFICFLSKIASQVTMFYNDPRTIDNDNIMFPMYTTSSVLMFMCSLVLVILICLQYIN